MPRGDRTGPEGLGPKTGRSAGYCAGYGIPGYMNPTFSGRDYAAGVGFFSRGRGWRHRYYATGIPGWNRETYGYPSLIKYPAQPSVEQEMELLQEQADFFQKQLSSIQKRISTLQKESSNKSK